MKVVKVHIRRGGKGEPMMVYPSRYDAQEVDRAGIGPTNVNPASVVYSGGIGRGELEEWCYIVLPDALADEYAQDPDMEIATEAQADADMEAWRVANGVADTVIRDPDRVREIRRKQDLRETLTREEQDAIDPDHPMPGLNRARRSVTRFTQQR